MLGCSQSVAPRCPIVYMYIHDAAQHSVSQSDSWAAAVTKVQTVRKTATDDEETARWKIGWFCSETTAAPTQVRDNSSPSLRGKFNLRAIWIPAGTLLLIDINTFSVCKLEKSAVVIVTAQSVFIGFQYVQPRRTAKVTTTGKWT